MNTQNLYSEPKFHLTGLLKTHLIILCTGEFNLFPANPIKKLKSH